MKITGIIRLDDVVEKIESKHHVSDKEVEEALFNKPKIKKMESGYFRGEHVYRALGQSYSGRYLTVFFIHKLTGEALILSARDMDEREHKSYVRK